MGQLEKKIIHTIGTLEMPFFALPYFPVNILENLRSEGTMRKVFF